MSSKIFMYAVAALASAALAGVALGWVHNKRQLYVHGLAPASPTIVKAGGSSAKQGRPPAGSDCDDFIKDEAADWFYTGDGKLELCWKVDKNIYAMPKLLDSLRNDALATFAKDRAEYLRRVRERDTGPYGHMIFEHRIDWHMEGQTVRLVSLSAEDTTDEGGAHEYTDHKTSVFDKSTGSRMRVSDLFGNWRAVATQLQPLYCNAYLNDRDQNSENTSECPNVADIQLTFKTSDDGLIRVLTGWAEVEDPAVGGDIVDFALPGSLVSLVKPEYASSFGE